MSHVSKKQNMNRKILKVGFLGVFCRKINKKPIFKPEYGKKQKPILAPVLYALSNYWHRTPPQKVDFFHGR